MLSEDFFPYTGLHPTDVFQNTSGLSPIPNKNLSSTLRRKLVEINARLTG